MKTTASTTCNLLTTKYAKDVTLGKIVTSKKVKQACQRHLKDLKRQGRRDFPYIFDEIKGYRPIKFIEQYCKPYEGDFDEIKLQPWDHFIIGSLFGWVHKKTGRRRFKYAVIFMARKQGKTLKYGAALSLFAAMKDGENGAKVYHLANAMKQSRLTFDPCTIMVKKSPALKKRLRPLREAIYYDKTSSKIEPQASDSEKLDGLNCHYGVFDEIHEYKQYKLINVIKNSTASRSQPLIIYVTTAGYQLDGPLMDFYDRGEDVLEGVITDERTFYFMAELDKDDDIEDPANWIKANPNLGLSVHLDDMIEEWNERKHVPAERNDFITKRLNVFVQADEQSFITFELIKRNDGVIDLELLRGRQCIGGFDLSAVEDFTSACLEFPLDDGRVFVLSHSWVPRRKVELDNEKVPYLDWQKDGLLTVCKGDYVDYRLVYEWFVNKLKDYSILKIAYDPANAFRLVKDLADFGGTEWMQVVRQGALTLSPALKDIKVMFLDSKVVFNRNKLFRWYLNNIKLVDDRNGNWLPTKQNRYRKIDGFAAWLNAHTETMKLMNVDMSAGGGGVGFISMRDVKK